MLKKSLWLAATLVLLSASIQAGTPTNDNLANAMLITPASLPFSTTVDTTGATTEINEVVFSSSTATVWFKFTPDTNGTYVFDTCGTPDDLSAGLYTGSGHPLTQIVHQDNDDCANNEETITQALTAGTTYYWVVSELSGGFTNLVINVWNPADIPAPTNDNLADALTVTVPYSANTTDVGSTIEPGESIVSSSHVNTLWYSFTPSQTGFFSFDTCGSDHDQVIGLFQGDTFPLMSIFEEDDDDCGSNNEQLQFAGIAGQTYRIGVSGYSGDTGSVRINFYSVTAANTAPSNNSTGTYTMRQGNTYDTNRNWFNAGGPGDYVTLQISGNIPNGIQITKFGRIIGTPTQAAVNGSPYVLNIVATDAFGLQISSTRTLIVLNVNDQPSLSGADHSVTPNKPFTLNLKSLTVDPDPGDIHTWSAAGLPPGLSINTATGVISGTVSAAAAAASPYTVTLAVNDNSTDIGGAKQDTRIVKFNILSFFSSTTGQTRLGPVPGRVSQPTCMYFKAAPMSSNWQVFNSGGDRVAELTFGSEAQQCWNHPQLKPGMYFVVMKVSYADGSSETTRQKLVFK